MSSFIICTNVVSLSHFSPQMIKVNTACTVITVRQLCNNGRPILTIYVFNKDFMVDENSDMIRFVQGKYGKELRCLNVILCEI